MTLQLQKKKKAPGLRPDFERAESYIPIYKLCCTVILSVMIWKKTVIHNWKFHFISLLCKVQRWHFTHKDWCNGTAFTAALKRLILWQTLYQLDYPRSKLLTIGIHSLMFCSGSVSDSHNNSQLCGCVLQFIWSGHGLCGHETVDTSCLKL